jgi:hypothetical protein
MFLELQQWRILSISGCETECLHLAIKEIDDRLFWIYYHRRIIQDCYGDCLPLCVIGPCINVCIKVVLSEL